MTLLELYTKSCSFKIPNIYNSLFDNYFVMFYNVIKLKKIISAAERFYGAAIEHFFTKKLRSLIAASKAFLEQLKIKKKVWK